MEKKIVKSHVKNHKEQESNQTVVPSSNTELFVENEPEISRAQDNSQFHGGVDSNPIIKEPPEFLYYGTDGGHREGIGDKNGKLSVRMQRDLFKLMPHCGAIVSISAHEMYEDGYKFYVTSDGTWLTDYVPFKYLGITWVIKNE